MARKIKDAVVDYSLLTDWHSWTGKKYTAKDSLYAWYQFETDVSTSGNLPDLSGNSRNLSPENDPADRIESPTTDSPRIYSSPSGFPTHSAAFDNDAQEFVDPSGTDDFSFGSPSSNSDSPYSVEIWVKTTAPDPSAIDQVILGKYNTSVSNSREWVIFLNNGKPEIFLSSDGTTSNTIKGRADTVLETNRWYHIVTTYDGSGTKEGLNVYVDTQFGPGSTTQIQAGSYDGMTGSTAARFTIGNMDNESGSTDFIGKLAQAVIWSKELSSEEVGALYEARQDTADFKSGICSVPVRLQLRERDQIGGKSPINKRVGDRDSHRDLL